MPSTFRGATPHIRICWPTTHWTRSRFHCRTTSTTRPPRAALVCGKHVLVDKPLTLRLDHASELVTLAERRGLTLMVAFNRHYEPPFTKAHELLRDGAIGELRLIQAYMAYDWDLWLQPPERRFTGAGATMLDGVSDTQATLLHETSFRGDAAANGGGFFADGGAHLLEACLWLAGSPAATVFAQMDSPEADLYTALNLRLASGVLCSLACIGDTPVPRDFAFNLYGTTGAYPHALGPPHVGTRTARPGDL